LKIVILLRHVEVYIVVVVVVGRGVVEVGDDAILAEFSVAEEGDLGEIGESVFDSVVSLFIDFLPRTKECSFVILKMGVEFRCVNTSQVGGREVLTWGVLMVIEEVVKVVTNDCIGASEIVVAVSVHVIINV